MFGVIAEVEFLFDLGRRQCRRDLGIGKEFFLEVLALFPDLHGVALDEAIGVLAADAGLSEGKKDALAHHEATELVHVPEHVLGVDDELFDHTGEAVEREIEGDGRVRRDAALDGRVRDIALVPEGHVLHRRDNRHPHKAGKAGEIFGQDRVALVRHGRRALLAGREELFRFQNLGALHMADLDGDVLDRGGDDAEGGKEHRVAVARDHLRADRLGAQAKHLADVLFDGGINIGEGADRARDRAGGDLFAGGQKAGLVAVHLGVEAGEGQAHGRRLGVDAVAAADADGILVLEGALLERGEDLVHVGQKDIGGADELDVEGGVEDVGRGHTLMDESGLGRADVFGKVGEEGYHIMFGDGFDFVDAARASGASAFTIVRVHVLGNVLGPILVYATSLISVAIILAAGLSFLGLGVKPPEPEWGLMLSTARGFMPDYWWTAIFPGLAIFVSVLSFNLLGDGLRDAIDPRLTNKQA